MYVTNEYSKEFPKPIHCYTSPEGGFEVKPPGTLDESLPEHREIFPQIEDAKLSNNFNCDIIHVRSSLSLCRDRFPANSELFGRFKITIPKHERHLQWHCVQTMYKDKALCGPINDDPPVVNKLAENLAVRESDDGSHVIQVAFSAKFWAHAFALLADLDDDFHRKQGWDRNTADEQYHRETEPSCKLLEKTTMYQELYSSAPEDTEGQPWRKRAILAWTFRKVTSKNEQPKVTWEVLDPFPARDEVFSPSAGHYDDSDAVRSESFNNIFNSEPLPIMNNSTETLITYDPVTYGATPPLTAASTSTFDHGFSFPQSDVESNDMPFMSQASQHSDDVQPDQYYPKQYVNGYRTMDPASMSFDATNDQWPNPLPISNVYDQDATNYYPQLTTMAPPVPNVQIWDNENVFAQQDWNHNQPNPNYLYAPMQQQQPQTMQ